MNLDKSWIRCTNSACGKILHGQCVTVAAYQLARVEEWEQEIDPLAPDAGTQLSPSKKKNVPIEIIVSQRALHLGRKRLLFTDRQEGRSWERDIHCLACKQRIR